MNNIYFLILGMAIVTYLPRVIPFYLLKQQKLAKNLKLFLEYIPFTAIGALIIPGFIEAIPNHPIASIVGTITALLLSYLKNDLILSIVGAIISCFCLLLLGF